MNDANEKVRGFCPSVSNNTVCSQFVETEGIRVLARNLSTTALISIQFITFHLICDIYFLLKNLYSD